MIGASKSADHPVAVSSSSSHHNSDDHIVDAVDDFEFNVDIVHLCQKHIRFLQHMHSKRITTLSISEHSLHRYKDLWLPLLVEYTNCTNEATTTTDNNTITSSNDVSNVNHSNSQDVNGALFDEEQPPQYQQEQCKQQEQLIPPPDVAWLWHCHRLAPQDYKSYLGSTFLPSSTTATNATTMTGQEEDEDSSAVSILLERLEPIQPFVLSISALSMKVWTTRYPDEPYFLSTSSATAAEVASLAGSSSTSHHQMFPLQSNSLVSINQQSTTSDRKFKELQQQNRLTKRQTSFSSAASSSNQGGRKAPSMGCIGKFDLLASAERQSKFYWHVLDSKYLDPKFLRVSVDNYKKFLSFKRYIVSIHSNTTNANRKNKYKLTDDTMMIVPTYPIDLVWHTHILASINQYDDDCIRMIGTTLLHDDTYDDRSTGSSRNYAYENTAHLWKELFGTDDYKAMNGGYKGEPPRGYYNNSIHNSGSALRDGGSSSHQYHHQQLETVESGSTKSNKYNDDDDIVSDDKSDDTATTATSYVSLHEQATADGIMSTTPTTGTIYTLRAAVISILFGIASCYIFWQILSMEVSYSSSEVYFFCLVAMITLCAILVCYFGEQGKQQQPTK